MKPHVSPKQDFGRQVDKPGRAGELRGNGREEKG
jgi:hypothetical protein